MLVPEHTVTTAVLSSIILNIGKNYKLEINDAAM